MTPKLTPTEKLQESSDGSEQEDKKCSQERPDKTNPSSDSQDSNQKSRQPVFLLFDQDVTTEEIINTIKKHQAS